MRWLTLGAMLIFAAIGGLALYAVVEYALGKNATANCHARGGHMVDDVCPKERRYCETTKHGTHCVDVPCTQRCVEGR